MKAKYAQKYRDPRWQKKRLEVMQRDGFKCLFCGAADKTLNVHHCYYIGRRDPWDYESASLFTLCEKCHGEVSDPDPDHYSDAHQKGFSWQLETWFMLETMLRSPSDQWDKIDVYAAIANSAAVLSGDVNPAEAAKIVSAACSYLMSPEWLETLKLDAAKAKGSSYKPRQKEVLP